MVSEVNDSRDFEFSKIGDTRICVKGKRVRFVLVVEFIRFKENR